MCVKLCNSLYVSNSNILLVLGALAAAAAAAAAYLLLHSATILSIKCSHTLIATAIFTTVLPLSQRRAHHSALLPHDDVTVNPGNGIQVHSCTLFRNC
jgi:hypothetical protein